MDSQITPFDFELRTRVVFGPGVADRLGEITESLGIRRALIVTDAGIVAAGHVDSAVESLVAKGIRVSVFDAVSANPTTDDVDACLAAARDAGIDGIIGLGGGSSMDTGKGCNFLLTNGGRMEDYWGVGKATKPMLPLIAVPTTAGTGSECQSFALIANSKTHAKMACGDPKAAPRAALLDPMLTLSQPRSVTACTGIDALAHALETAVTRKRNVVSALYSREAFRLIVRSLPRVLEEPGVLEARAEMLLGAAFAGIAIENSMLGAAHSAANPLTAHFGTAHGHAVGAMLPHVIRFNGRDPTARALYHEWAAAAGIVRLGASEESAVEAMACVVSEMLGRAGLPESPVAGVAPLEQVPMLAEEAAKQWTAAFNPRPVQAADFEELYRVTLGA